MSEENNTMERDMELVRHILLEIEKMPYIGSL